jgi:precorrin-4 methylase
LLQNQILTLNKTLDDRLTQNNTSLNKNMLESLKTSTHIADSSNKNIEAITKKLTELSETNKQIKDI